MIWSHFGVAWEGGLAAARGWAAEHGHLLAPLDATHQGAEAAYGDRITVVPQDGCGLLGIAGLLSEAPRRVRRLRLRF